jgi:hypothetical protein
MISIRSRNLAFTILALSACSASLGTRSSSPKVQPPPPQRDDPHLQTKQPVTGKPCIPAGEYSVIFDLSSAQITPQGSMSIEFCRSVAVAVPKVKLAKMKISYLEGGGLAVEWPNRRSVAVKNECELEITSEPAPSRIVFGDGIGHGTSDYVIGTGNPNERGDVCKVAGATLRLVLSTANVR